MDRAEKTGDLAVRLHLKRPTPAALEYLALVTGIWPKAYRERVGPEGYARAPIGTGPYRITRVETGTVVEFERFDGYYAGGPKGKPAIRRMTARFVPDAATELTELLAGRVDWIWNMNPDQFDNVNRMPNLQAVRQESMRVGYLQLDAAGRSGAGNPMTNLKVRQAVWHAIDRKRSPSKLVTGGVARAAGALLPRRSSAATASAAVTYDYDPAKARRCWPRPASPTASTSSSSATCSPQWSEAVQNYLQAVGIRARINQMQVAAAIQRAWRGETPMYHGQLGQLLDQRRLGDPAQYVRRRRTTTTPATPSCSG